MQQAHSISIHEFDPLGLPVHYDDEGDQMVGFYYQMTDENNQPLSALVGPYSHAGAAEKAAVRAYRSGDF